MSAGERDRLDVLGRVKRGELTLVKTSELLGLSYRQAKRVAVEDGELPTGAELERVLDSAAGLTRYEAEGAFALSLARHSRISAEVIWELKA